MLGPLILLLPFRQLVKFVIHSSNLLMMFEVHTFLFLLRVKLAVDLRTQQQVAVKILKVKEGRATEFSKYQSLDCLYSEISILADCDHNNVVKIKATSFDGTIVKELIPNR